LLATNMAAIPTQRLRVIERERRRNNSTPNFKPQLAPKKKSVFPETPTISGHLFITKIGSNKRVKWKNRYFCLKHNFLLSAHSEDAEKLERVISLDGAQITDINGCLQINTHRKTYQLKAENDRVLQNWAVHIRTATSLSIEDLYEIGGHLGVSATQNTTVVCGVCKTTLRRVAIKIVDKRTCDHRLLANEVKILKKLEHPYVVQLYDIFETPDILYLIMERLEGGELFEQLTSRGEGFHYSEREVCEIIRQIAHGVKYMHEMGIVHRDLKPENILCTDNSVSVVKVADFGISKCLGEQEDFMRTMCGTISYTAPEVIKGQKYGREVDYWSIGVIMYILLCGYPPFYGESDFDIAASIISAEIEMPEEEWAHVSEEGKEVVRQLLSRDPSTRMTLENLLLHTWHNTSSVAETALATGNNLAGTYEDRQKKRNKNKGKHVTTGWLDASGGFNMPELRDLAQQTLGSQGRSNQQSRRRNVSYGGFVEKEQDDEDDVRRNYTRN